MAHVPVDAAYIEAFAKLADEYARIVRSWLPAVELARKQGQEPTLNGVQTLVGNLERELERLALIGGQVGKIDTKAKRAYERGAAKHAEMPDRRKKKG
jgi:hypothetical protein